MDTAEGIVGGYARGHFDGNDAMEFSFSSGRNFGAARAALRRLLFLTLLVLLASSAAAMEAIADLQAGAVAVENAILTAPPADGVSVVLTEPHDASPATALPVVEAEVAHPAAVPLCVPCLPRPQDEQWLISTRHLGCCAGPVDTSLAIHRLVDAQWQRQSLADLTMTGDLQHTVTLIYIHGNRVDANDAVARGNRIYHRLAPLAPAEMSLRVVTWSWPSDQIHGQMQDVRVKAARTNLEGFLLGSTLAAFPGDARISLLGYSFGARIATGGLHVLGGGSLAGRCIESLPLRLPIRTTLTAGAVDRCWIVPGSVHGRAVEQMDALLLLYNSCDPVLKRYHMLEKRSHPAALGYTGIAPSALGVHAAKLEQYDACPVVGKTHAEAGYYSSCWMLQRMAANLLWESVDAL